MRSLVNLEPSGKCDCKPFSFSQIFRLLISYASNCLGKDVLKRQSNE